jgi:uncharacterized protein
MRGITIQLTIAISVWSLWLLLVGPAEAIAILSENFAIASTMLLGSFVAGSTSVGGGAVAFPVFTKVLHIDSNTALVFSLAIQSVGMTAAALFIVISKVPVCFRIIRYSVIIGGLGLFTSFFLVRLHIPSADIKYLFSCFSFIVGAALLWAQFRREVQEDLAEITDDRILLTIGCFFGGMLSGIIGTGIDFILFTLMIFCWHYEFKKAVATSVVIMGINALLGFIAILLCTDQFTGAVVSYWLAAVPIVVVGAPLGALVCSRINKSIMVYFLLLLIILDILSTIIILGIRAEYLLTLATLFMAMFCYKNLQRKKMLTDRLD